MPVSIKICGMKDPDNISIVSNLRPDYMGFIFYEKSPRYAGELDPSIVRSIPSGITKVGVFVNETAAAILRIAEQYQLNAIQLHGNESPEICHIIRTHGLSVIKALSVASPNDIEHATHYTDSCNYLLFDTKTPLYGGSGKQYDWSILSAYTGQLPFFLSGGIGAEDAERILSFSHPQLTAIDINSKFEIRPGFKDTAALQTFIENIRTKNIQQ